MTAEAQVAIAADNSKLLRVLEESKSAMTEFFETITEKAGGVGTALEGVNEKFSNAFEFTGLALATEAIEKIGETIEQLGQRALEMKTVSSVIGVTTDQFQAMQQAAEEAGVGAEQLTHAGERLVSVLTEARNGSSAAIDKLLNLGVSIQQVNDPTFRLNDLLQVLHEQLENSSTSQETMNQLILVLGNRAALAAAAIKEYDGSAQSVQATIDRINGLTETQIDRLGKAKTSWSEYWTTIKNGMTQAFLGSGSLDLKGLNAFSLSNAGSASQAENSLKSQGNPFEGLSEQANQAAEQAAEAMKKAAEDSARTQENLNREIQQQELENMKAGVAAYQEGSRQKLAALQREYDFAQQVYGSSQVDKVKAIYQQIIAEQKAVYDSDIRGSELAKAAEDQHVAGVLRGYSNQIEANQRYFDEAVQNQKQLDQLSEFSEELQTKLLKERSQLLEQQRALDQRVANEWYEKWSGVAGAIQSSFSGAIMGMLQGTMTFAGALRSIFSSVIESLIQMFVKMGVQWAEGLLYQQVAQKATAISSISANAGIAATAAMASVAAIPFYGWAMAPEVGASTFAEAIAYMASASAAGGFDIPAGQNPVTQLHAREMVLPAPIADTVRGAMDRGGTSGRPINIYGGKGSNFTHDQVLSVLKELGHQFKLR